LNGKGKGKITTEDTEKKGRKREGKKEGKTKEEG
jgi:hypothetical protein